MNHSEPIFVTGMPRSGTTLLASLLNAHSQVAISPETDYFPRVWKPLARRAGTEDWTFVNSALSRFFEKLSVKLMGLPEAELRAEFHNAWKNRRLTHAAMLSRMFGLYAELRGKTIWGEKTPDHFMYVPAIKSTFPDARVIAITRDPRDVHLSLSKVPWSRGNALNHALQWRGYQSMAREFRMRYGETFIQIRYEDLITAPQKTMQDLCERLEITFEPQMIDRRDVELIFDPEHEPWKAAAAQAIDPTNRDKWRRRMPPAEIALFARICGKYMRRLDYDVPTNMGALPRPVLKNLEWRSVAWWARTRWRTKRGRDLWLGNPWRSD